MKIAYNFNNRLIVQEVLELPTFEHVVIDNIDLSIFFNPIVLNGVLVEGATQEEIAEERNKKAIEIDLEYTERISKLMAKHNDKFIEGLTNGVPYIIPQDVLIEKQRLKDECNQLIADLGVTDYSYRQNNLQLKK